MQDQCCTPTPTPARDRLSSPSTSRYFRQIRAPVLLDPDQAVGRHGEPPARCRGRSGHAQLDAGVAITMDNPTLPKESTASNTPTRRSEGKSPDFGSDTVGRSKASVSCVANCQAANPTSEVKIEDGRGGQETFAFKGGIMTGHLSWSADGSRLLIEYADTEVQQPLRQHSDACRDDPSLVATRHSCDKLRRRPPRWPSSDVPYSQPGCGPHSHRSAAAPPQEE
jgi:hypothetical protein